MRKVQLLTLATWMLVTTALTYWYVFIAWHSTPIDAEYETYPGFRLGFFAITFLPVLIVILALVLWLEHRYLRNG